KELKWLSCVSTELRNCSSVGTSMATTKTTRCPGPRRRRRRRRTYSIQALLLLSQLVYRDQPSNYVAVHDFPRCAASHSLEQTEHTTRQEAYRRLRVPRAAF